MAICISTVICNYNTRDDLARALDALIGAAMPDHEIIVVDNASCDGSAALVRSHYPDVRLIETGANLWFSGGNNAGLRAAQGEYALILNSDATVAPDTLSTLAAYLDAQPEVGAVTARMTFADGTRQNICSRLSDYRGFWLDYTFLGVLLPSWRARHRRSMWYADWDRESTRAVEVAPGSCLMLRRSLAAQVGYFDERLKLFFTDDDLCRKIIATGAQIHYVAGTTVIHDEHASLKQFPHVSQRIYWEDLIAYTRKYHGRTLAWMLRGGLAPTRIGMELNFAWQARFSANGARGSLRDEG